MGARASGSIIKVYCTLSGFNLSIVTARIIITWNRRRFMSCPLKLFLWWFTTRREISYFVTFLKKINARSTWKVSCVKVPLYQDGYTDDREYVRVRLGYHTKDYTPSHHRLVSRPYTAEAKPGTTRSKVDFIPVLFLSNYTWIYKRPFSSQACSKRSKLTWEGMASCACTSVNICLLERAWKINLKIQFTQFLPVICPLAAQNGRSWVAWLFNNTDKN